MVKWTYGGILAGLTKEFQRGFLENPDLFEREEYFTDISEITKGQIVLSQDQMLSFWNFYNNRLHHGTNPFNYYDCLTETDLLMSFTSKPSSQERNGWYFINIEVRVL